MVLLTLHDPGHRQFAVRFSSSTGSMLSSGAARSHHRLPDGHALRAQDTQMHELRETYHGVLMILRHFISKDKYTENHCYRVSVYATRIAAELDLAAGADRGRSRGGAAARHRQAGCQPRAALQGGAADGGEFERCRTHVDRGVAMLEPVGGSLRRVMPIVLAHHDKFDGSGYHPRRAKHSRRGAHHLGRRCLRRAHQRPAVSQGDVAVRGPRLILQGHRHGLRPAGRRRVRHGVP